MIRVIIVDDQTLVRQGIRGLLELGDDIDVVAEADNGMSGLAVVKEHRPDVLLLDLRMPQYDGVWLLEQLRDHHLEVPVLVLTTFDDDALVMRALRAGARGYLLKDVTLDQLLEGVRGLASGGTLIHPAVTERLLRVVRSGEAPTPLDDGVPSQPLTDRELNVLRLMAAGFTNKQIATSMHLAPGTVKNHVSMVLLKLNSRDRTNAVLRALHHGILG